MAVAKLLPSRIYVARTDDGLGHYVADLDVFDDGEIVGTYQLVETSTKRVTHTLGGSKRRGRK